LKPVYERFASGYNGMLARDSARWESVLKDNDKRASSTFIYRRDGEVEGYARVRYREKEEEAEATELIALSNRAYRGLLGVIRRYVMTVKSVRWRAPFDDSLWSIPTHWDVETKLEPEGMSRIVDVSAALQALKPDSGIRDSAVISVEDQKAPWNTGVWRISAESGRVEARKGSAEPGVRLDIQALTQAYWGAPSLDRLRRAGRVDVVDERDYSLLAALLPPTPVWLLDDF
jgi:predicted acetyltransferase